MDKSIAPAYIRANFRNDDRIAVVLIQKSAGRVTQRISTAGRVASEEFQAWLRYMNSQKQEVYISMNVLKPEARGRRKTDVVEIRHVYLDFDHNGTEAVHALRSHPGMPEPNHILESSSSKYQVVWRVKNFNADQAETLMRLMARKFGADPAATDSARVLRLPGLHNHKYNPPHLIINENLSSRTYAPIDFPASTMEDRPLISSVEHLCSPRQRVGGSQSERDWRFALRALRRGEEPKAISQAIERYRQDKPDPRYYAEHTVEKAATALGGPGEARSHLLAERLFPR